MAKQINQILAKLSSVEGEVVKPNGAPLQSYRVRAFDRAISEWRLLGEARTNESGKYQITYDVAQLKSWGKERADLKVEVFGPKGETALSSSPLFLQALPEETINFAIGDEAYRGPDEYSVAEKALAPLLKSIADPSRLEVGDVRILARESKVPAATVAYYLKAQRWSKELDAPAAVFYGLLRANQSTRKDALFARPFPRLWKKLQEAVAQNFIDLPLDDSLQARLKETQQRYLTQPDHPFSRLLKTTSLSPKQQAAFTQRLTTQTQSQEDFWNTLESEAGISAEKIADLRDTFELQAFTGDNASLTIHLREALKVRRPRDVAAFTTDDWQKILKSSGVEIPADFLAGKPEDVRRAAYAQGLYRSAEVRYPTNALSAQLSREKVWADRAVLPFLKAHPDFDFNKQRLTHFLRDQPEALKSLPNPDAAKRDLLRFEQLFHLTPAEDKLAAMQTLWDAGLTSARQIATTGRQHLIRRVGENLPRPIQNRIYQQSVHTTAVALNVHLKYHQGLNRNSLYALRAPQLPQPAKADQPQFAISAASGSAPANIPEWTELFGTADACECSHCESTLSPSAYLVDMLDFLNRASDGDNPHTSKTALDHLLERRPDLGFLQLTCENTETEMPQIDLVIEILEQIVAFSRDGQTIPTTHVGQTTWDRDLLAAQPENFEPKAYERLRNLKFPFDRLPFDLWLEEGRRYLKQMQVARDELMRVMPAHADVTELEIATETLQMSTNEREIIRVPNRTQENLAECWGVDLTNRTLRQQLVPVKSMLRQARLDYDALLHLLNTRYVNADRLVTITFAGDPCAVEDASLTLADGSDLGGAEFGTFLDRLHRFQRLRRRLGWTEYELDTVIKALSVSDFDKSKFLIKLADLKKLHDTLKLSVAELSSWWADLDTYAFEEAAPSQYEQIFLNPTVFPDTHTGAGPDLRNEVFALTANRADLLITTSRNPNPGKWLAESDGAAEPAFTLQPDYAAYIQSAVRLTSSDILLLVAEILPKDPTSGNVALTLANVSLLYRIASFTRALGISVQDYLYLARLTGLAALTTPAAIASPTDSLAAQELQTEIASGEWEFDELAYLLLHDPKAVINYGPRPEDMDTALAQLSPAFAGVTGLRKAKESDELKAVVLQSLAMSLGLDVEVLDQLLFSYRESIGDALLANLVADANGAGDVPAFKQTYETLHKFAIAWKGLGLDSSHLEFVLDSSFGWTDIAALPLTEQTAADFKSWQRLIRAAALQLSLFSTEQSLFGLLKAAKDAAHERRDFLNREEFLTETAAWTGWNIEDLNYLTGPDGFNYTYPNSFRREDWIGDLDQIFSIVRPLGVSARQAHAYTIRDLTFSETESIKQALTLAYEPDEWLEVLAEIEDELRVLKRDALMGRLLNTLSSDDPNDVYKYYLIDPEMAPCARTSRIVEAHAAVQLFGQRILLNLEPPLSFAREDAEAWQWRKNYRVWEAARKIFLYPENWLEPELRDNKSIFFQELEDGLLQDEVNLDTAERLYREYLRKLDQVSRLDIMGIYEDTWINGDCDVKVLHVFGRTQDIPHLIYYRRWENQSRWTPWEQVALDIQGDHLTPVVYNGRLYLFWPTFKLTPIEPYTPQLDEEIAELTKLIKTWDDNIKVLEEQIADLTAGAPQLSLLKSTKAAWEEIRAEAIEDKAEKESYRQAKIDNTKANEVEVEMAWSTYTDGRWSPKLLAIGGPKLKTDYLPENFFFAGWISDDNRLYVAMRANYVWTDESFGYFYFDDCQSALVYRAGVPSSQASDVRVTDSVQSFDSRRITGTALSLDVNAQAGPERRLLLETPSAVNDKILYAHQYGQAGSKLSSFFHMDGRRTYFVQPLEGFAPVQTGVLETEAIAYKAAAAAFPSGHTASTVQIQLSSGQAVTESKHYQGSASDQIIDRARAQSELITTGWENDTIEKLLTEDTTATVQHRGETVLYTDFAYRFTRFYHPYTCLFLKQLSRAGLDGLLNPHPDWGAESKNLHRQLTPNERFDFQTTYQPTDLVRPPYPNEEIDFDHYSPYGSYNWELFFHIPLLIATRLMQNQRFAEARKWFQYVFDPTYSEGKPPARFWKIKPFYEEQSKELTETLAELLDGLAGGDPEFEEQVQDWEQDPFQPHVIARLRIVAYMQTTVMKYLDCLIGEADMLFTMDTREAINEAAQLYLLAGEILGERPTVLPPQRATTYTPNQILGRISISITGPTFIDPLDSLTAQMPSLLPGRPPTGSAPVLLPGAVALPQGAMSNYGTLLLFCLPSNDKLYAYWDIVADRLFKIRHCMNISGQVRRLALFAPPIDPALLVRASAAGLDIASILAGLYAPLPNYRFSFMLQKAAEFCGDVRNLGGALLATLEKKDGEQLSLLRSRHEISLLRAMRALKQKNVEEARTSLDALIKSKEAAEFRIEYYANLERVSTGEQTSLDKQEDSRHWQMASEVFEVLASINYAFPEMKLGPTLPEFEFGGLHLGGLTQAVAGGLRSRAAAVAYEANKAGIMAGYQRRQQDWLFQIGLAKKEIDQLDKQILAAEIRQQIAEADLENHDQQIAQSEEVEEFLKMKFSNQQLYSWMLSKLSSLYFQSYQMAYRLAKQTEKCFLHELGPDEQNLSFIQSTYWDSLQKGLLAGEQLNYDLRRMEDSHIAANKRELEMTKHISLWQLDPAALLELRETGKCRVHVPEVFFDMDFAGHYFRRIKSLRLTLPCVVGPYTNVSAALRLEGSWIRRQADLNAALESVTGLPQTAIATSSANQDGGVFELNFNDPRYLPFEGAGVVSTWQLELPTALRPFDYDTITDVVIHVSYTAREAQDGGAFKDQVNRQIESDLNDLRKAIGESDVTLTRLISLRQEFAADWSRFLSSAEGASQQITLNLTKQHFPRYLDYLWEKNDDGKLGPLPITLNIDALKVYLNPRGTMPPDEVIEINETAPKTESNLTELLYFDSVPGLSSNAITNESGAQLTLTVSSGRVRPEDWKDMYVLLQYHIDAQSRRSRA